MQNYLTDKSRHGVSIDDENAARRTAASKNKSRLAAAFAWNRAFQ
ncbi:MAG TPA: hypothetical protein VMT94_07180 [Burkholderiales bacterium]|nr:hypothetical protein [Burkholderiales bacterium]